MEKAVGCRKRQVIYEFPVRCCVTEKFSVASIICCGCRICECMQLWNHLCLCVCVFVRHGYQRWRKCRANKTWISLRIISWRWMTSTAYFNSIKHCRYANRSMCEAFHVQTANASARRTDWLRASKQTAQHQASRPSGMCEGEFIVQRQWLAAAVLAATYTIHDNPFPQC